ncbi:c2H2-type domain-containing protein [Trichonephila clavata]|uniref:C2H2-type domain-containing protein n=1 Tax=Trichonephila clavata TaxID=2740835 RepID=A0A8X6FYS7_TRICU|nr:c2H2-type domain-containing protein [Trichonephila clavata]GFQ92635.1 c2H2-type domain-containing protein [Trichonephila clavata]
MICYQEKIYPEFIPPLGKTKNIKRCFGLTNQRHTDDPTSVRLMLEEMAELGTDNPILGCKFQGCLSFQYEGLNNKDFFRVLQHPLQKEMLKKFGKNTVLILHMERTVTIPNY